MTRESLRRGAWALAPFVIVGLLYAVLTLYGRWTHQRDLPDDYEREEIGRFEVYYPPEARGQVERIVAGGERFLETAGEEYGELLGGVEPPSGTIRLTLFRNDEEFERFASGALDEDLSHNGGYYEATRNEIALVMSAVDDVDQMGIRHELAHMLLARGGGQWGSSVPPWLTEGLATWLETTDVEARALGARVQQWVKMVVVVTSTPPVQAVVGVDSDAFSREGNHVAYAYSALLVHFLVRRSARAFWAYTRAARSGEAKGASGVTDFFGDLDALDADWQPWVREARHGFAAALRTP